MTNRDSAIAYAQQLGWAIVPLTWILPDGSCSCGGNPCKGKPGKHPNWKVAPNGVKDASSDPAVVDQWWTAYPDMNIGVRTGPESGIVVLDVDSGGGKQGASSLQQMQADAAAPLVLQGQVCAQSGSGGYHYYFAWPQVGEVGNATNAGGYTHVDIKGRDGYIIVDPSLNSAGPYKWLIPPWQAGAVMPPLPEFLIQCAQTGKKTVQGAPFSTVAFTGSLPARVEKFRSQAKVARYLEKRKPRTKDQDKTDSGIDLQICLTLLNQDDQLDDWELHHALLWSWQRNNVIRNKGTSYFASTIAMARASVAAGRLAALQPAAFQALSAIPTANGSGSVQVQVMDTEDRDNAARFKVMWEGRLLWEPHSGRHGRWLEYQDGIWVEGGGEAGLVKCDEIVRHYDLEIQQLSQQPGTSTDTLKLYKKARQALRNVPARSRALSLAKELMSADRIEFDANPLLVCCEDTVLDLSDAQQVHARPPTPEDYLRSRVRASWSGPTQGPDLPASFWEERVAEWLPEPEVREAFQMFIGLCLTGSLAYQVFGFLYGSGGTGKSTAANAILEVLGGYGMTSKFKHFTEQRGRDSAGVSPHLVRMKGRRLVAAFEVSRGASFDTALIKSLTGGEKVVGRGLYQDETEFKATAKLLFVGNDRPKVDREDSALWRRLVVFGFHTPQGSRRNVHLPQQLASSEVRNQILRWAVEGWQRLQQKPEFPIPGPCSAEVKRWQEESDLLREFVEECCELDPEAWVSSQDLWEAYLGWVGDTKSALNRKGFSQALLRPGVESKRSGDKANTRGFQGIRLRSPLAGENTS